MKEYVPPPLLPLHIYSVELLSFTSRWDEGDNRTHRCPCNNNIMHHLCKQQQKKRGMKWWFYGSFPSSPVLLYIFLNDKTDEMECKIILQTDSTISLCGGGGGGYNYVFTNWIIYHRRLFLSDKSDTQECHGAKESPKTDTEWLPFSGTNPHPHLRKFWK